MKQYLDSENEATYLDLKHVLENGEQRQIELELALSRCLACKPNTICAKAFLY
jgi:hypothetical protein